MPRPPRNLTVPELGEGRGGAGAAMAPGPFARLRGRWPAAGAALEADLELPGVRA